MDNQQPKRTFIETARRKQLIESAIDTLAELGYVKTSLAQIAKRAKIATSVVSYYFAGKDDLMREVVAHIYGNVAEYMAAYIDVNAPVREVLRAYIASNLAYGREHLAQLKALSEIIIHWTAEPHKFPSETVESLAVLEPLEDILRAGQETGEFRSFNPRPVAMSIRKAIDGAFEQWLTTPDMDRDAYIEEVIMLFDIATRKQD